MKTLQFVGALIKDSHFVLTSGRHSRDYLDKDRLYPKIIATSRLCEAIARHFIDYQVWAVVAPEKGGIVLAHEVARHLSGGVMSFYAEKEIVAVPDPEGSGRKCYAETGRFIIHRGGAQTEIPGKNVLVVDDVLTTGGSAKKVVEAVRALGGYVVGLGALCNLGGVVPADVADPPEFWSLVNIRIDSWEEAECPLREQNVPINTDVGKGAEYLARKQAS